MSERRAQDVLDFWFGANPMAPEQIRQRMRLWFGGDEPPELRDLRDETLAERFGTLLRAAGAGQLDAWAGSPLAGLQTGADSTLLPIQRVFLYMPLQHSESPDVQDESVAAFKRLAADAPAEHRAIFDNCLQFAQLHQRIIIRFGRFPHRNAVLGRPSSLAEEKFLREEVNHFGQ